MSTQVLYQQNILLQNRERILSEIKKYPCVVNVGVGLKEVNNELTSILCFRVYVNEKKTLNLLQEHEVIPRQIDGFITDIIPYGEVIEISMDNKHYRPLKGGVQIKNDLYVDNKARGGGTLGCLVISNEDPDMILGLTNEHVVAWNSEDVPDGANDIGQPWKRICCCCCVKDVIGRVSNSIKNDQVDCATLELHGDIVNQIKSGGTINEIEGIGSFKGKAIALVGMLVKKRGAGTGLTHGIVKDIAFDHQQLLIGPVSPYEKFADFGDSGSIILNEDNRVVGLLWAAERNRFRIPGEAIINSSNIQTKIDPRIHGVATPIDAVIAALDIIIPESPPVTPTYSIHSDDSKTHIIPSTLSSSTKKHFVTAKGEGDIIIQVTFDQPIDPARVKWVSDNPFMPVTSPAVGTDKLTAKIDRNVSNGMKASVGVTVDGYGVGERVLVWIIWSEEVDYVPGDGLTIRIEQAEIRTIRAFTVVFKIQPEEIFPKNITEDDVPDLRGSNDTPPPNVSDSDTEVFNKGIDLSGGANRKWDASISLKYKIINPNNFFIDPTLPFSKSFPEYPSLNVVGNYDTANDPSARDPYSPIIPSDLGTISIIPVIVHSFPHSIAYFQGHSGQTIEFRIHHRVFARVELNGHWYTISDFFPGRIQLTYIIRDEWTEFIDYNSDGDKLDKVWYGENSAQCFYDDSNSGFDDP